MLPRHGVGAGRAPVRTHTVTVTMKRILFFHQGKFSNTNRALLNGLREQFPPAEIRSVDINKLLKGRPVIILANLAKACCRYGWDMLRGRRDLDDSFFSTRYVFEQVRKLAAGVHREWPADCSIQTQSIFDCSSPDRPHFIYTDHTYLSCREYPVYGTTKWSPIRRDWLIDLERGIYDHATCVFTMSRNVSQTLLREYGLADDRVLCVGGGCHVPHDRLARIPTDLPRYMSRRILFVGRHWDLKGGPELLRAFRLVREVHGNATLTIVGCQPKLRETNVEVLGFLSLDQMAENYGRASIFCMPSKIEAFGIAFLEAMRAGLPVVALRLGAAPDFVVDGQTGFLAEPGDIGGLASVLMTMIGDPQLCRRLGERGRCLVKRDYTWQRTCEKISRRILKDTPSKWNRHWETSNLGSEIGRL